MMTVYAAVRPNALPVSMNSHMRAATAKLTPLVEEPGKPCATVDRQPRGPFSGALAAHGWSSSKAGYLLGSGASLCSFRDSAPIRCGSDGPRFATSTLLSKPKRGPVRRGCCDGPYHAWSRYRVRGLIAVRLAHAIPSWPETLLRQERRTRVQIVISSVHATSPHSSASRLRPALSSRQ